MVKVGASVRASQVSAPHENQTVSREPVGNVVRLRYRTPLYMPL